MIPNPMTPMVFMIADYKTHDARKGKPRHQRRFRRSASTVSVASGVPRWHGRLARGFVPGDGHMGKMPMPPLPDHLPWARCPCHCAADPADAPGSGEHLQQAREEPVDLLLIGFHEIPEPLEIDLRALDAVGEIVDRARLL